MARCYERFMVPAVEEALPEAPRFDLLAGTKTACSIYAAAEGAFSLLNDPNARGTLKVEGFATKRTVSIFFRGRGSATVDHPVYGRLRYRYNTIIYAEGVGSNQVQLARYDAAGNLGDYAVLTDNLGQVAFVDSGRGIAFTCVVDGNNVSFDPLTPCPAVD